MRAYVQQLLESDLSYWSFNQIAFWFAQQGYEVIRYDYPQIDDGFLDRGLLRFPDETVVSGGVRSIQECLKRAKRPTAVFPSLPQCLEPWIGREVWATNFGEIRQMCMSGKSDLPLHIKPAVREKLFTGRIVEHLHDLARLGDVDDSEPVLAQRVVNFISEWRAYVFRQRIVHVGRYLGDPLVFPEITAMTKSLEAFEDRPISFSMDWGITLAGQTLLVEVNDGIALGNYGLGGEFHVAMIEARWRELMGLPDNGIGIQL